MAKLYVFSIGGTGTRVLRSLTMMLASGVDMGNIAQVVPIIIDPDHANASLSEAVGVMRNYNAVRKNLTFASANKNNFYKVDISEVLNNFTLPIKDTNQKTFSQFIAHSSMSRENQAMVKMLFSDKNLASKMDVGFKGNPNIGSVVLNQITNTNEFIDFANDFSQGDKIFIISSIFGGTGASGFPLLLKTLRCDKKIPNFNLINNAEIGALTVLPYFKIEQKEDAEIDSTTFIAKTKSALAYYENNVIGNNAINALYYLCDDMNNNTYEYSVGGTDQKNAAHLIEFFGATAIFDFAKGNYTGGTTNLELGLDNYTDTISFNHFTDCLANLNLDTSLSQLLLFSNYLKYHFDDFKRLAISSGLNFDDTFFNSKFYNDLRNSQEDYVKWLDEMFKNKHSLQIFNLGKQDNPFDIIIGRSPKKSRFLTKNGYSLFDVTLNGVRYNTNTKEDQLVEIFYIATKELFQKKLKK